MSARLPWREDARTLLRLDAKRLLAAAVRPTPGGAIVLLLPALLAAGALWAARGSIVPETATRRDAAALGMLVAAPIAFLSYGALFRAADDRLLHRVGVHPHARFAERAGRLLISALAIALVPVGLAVNAGSDAGGVAMTSFAVAMAAWALGGASSSLAARAMAGRTDGRGWGCLTIGMWDRELAQAAPLVYAPLVPLLGGGVVGAMAWGGGPGTLALVALASGALALRTARWWAAAIPRFGAQVLEMAFSPPPPAGVGELRVGRGLGRLMPRRAAAVWARDAAVAGRRFAWATRLVWPVAIVSLVLLARWGDEPATRVWIGAGALTVWLLQVIAMIGLGRYERAGRRWLDRALGISPLDRLLGRWAWGWGSGLWLAVPIALGWVWWTDGGSAWLWLAACAGTSAAGALASVAASGWR